MITWYLARGAGLAALVLLTATTCLGAVSSRRKSADQRNIGRRYIVQYLHRTTAGLGLVALTVHLVSILADPYAHVGWRGLLVPFTSGYRPQWIALGTFAVYLSLAVGALGLARGRLAATVAGARTWRGLHALGYLAWFSAVVHGFTSGSDSEQGWVRVLYLACLTAVGAAVAVRLSRSKPYLVRPALTYQGASR